MSPRDILYDEAVELVVASREVSVSMLQRDLLVGYTRAACMIERMEREGIVSFRDEFGHREVLRP